MFYRIARRGLILSPLVLSAGCNTVVLHPSGDIAAQQAHLITVSTLLMLLIIIPVIILTIIFAWRYRKSNTSAKYDPEWDHSTKLELVIWGVPMLLILTLGTITWVSTHRLDPFRPLSRIAPNQPIPPGTKPLEVDVVAMDWKWLFIYPEQGIATVNELATPVNVPVHFNITASSVMNSFYIPAMAGQIYAMPGMQTQLHAVMNKPGEYGGFSANYSGAGFSYMRFKYHALATAADFDAWVQKTRASGGALNRADYLTLEKPSINDPVRHYGNVAPDLFHAIVNECVTPGSVCMDKMMAADMHHPGAAMSAADMPKADAAPQVAQAGVSDAHPHSHLLKD